MSSHEYGGSDFPSAAAVMCSISSGNCPDTCWATPATVQPSGPPLALHFSSGIRSIVFANSVTACSNLSARDCARLGISFPPSQTFDLAAGDDYRRRSLDSLESGQLTSFSYLYTLPLISPHTPIRTLIHRLERHPSSGNRG